jgi:hypothetical protein
LILFNVGFAAQGQHASMPGLIKADMTQLLIDPLIAAAADR